MKVLPIIAIAAVVSLSLYGAMESSVKVPIREHQKYTFVNHKNHFVMKMEEEHYLRSLAPMSKSEIRKTLQSRGYEIHSIKLRDIASELVYEAQITDADKKSSIVHVDPQNGMILKTREVLP